MPEQHVLGVHGDVGLELADPPAARVLQAEQVVARLGQGDGGDVAEASTAGAGIGGGIGAAQWRPGCGGAGIMMTPGARSATWARDAPAASVPRVGARRTVCRHRRLSSGPAPRVR